jgi:integrase
MPGRQAKLITPTMLRRMLRHVATRRTKKRDRVIILLSAKAGLRASEIAKLDWSMVLDARGTVADSLSIPDAIAKKRGGRRIPLHPDLRRALVLLKRDAALEGPVVCSVRGARMRPTSLVNWFAFLFREFARPTARDPRDADRRRRRLRLRRPRPPETLRHERASLVE